MKRRRASNKFSAVAAASLVMLQFSMLAAFSDDEICGTCGPEVRLSGTFTHRKDNPSMAIEGAGNNAAAYREDVNGTNFTVTIASLPASKYTITIGAAETFGERGR